MHNSILLGRSYFYFKFDWGVIFRKIKIPRKIVLVKCSIPFCIVFICTISGTFSKDIFVLYPVLLVKIYIKNFIRGGWHSLKTSCTGEVRHCFGWHGGGPTSIVDIPKN